MPPTTTLRNPSIKHDLAVLFLLGLSASYPVACNALEATASVQVLPVLKAQTSWDGNPISYPDGQAEVTGMLVEIAPGADTGWHQHLVPSFGMLLEGELEVRLKDGRSHHLHAGEALAEVTNTWHNGHNPGTVPAKIIVFYASAVGKQMTIKEPQQ